MNHTNNDNNNAPLEKSVSTATSTTTTTASIERKLLEWIFYIICVVIYKLIFNLYKNYTRGATYDKYKENQQPNGFDSNENDNHESNANNNDDSDYDDANDDCEERKQKQKNDDSKCAYILQLIITESNNELNQTIKNPTKAFNSDNINIQKQQRKKYLLIFCNKKQNSACQTKRSSTSTTTTANDPNHIGKIEYNNCHFYCCGYCYCNCQLCCCGYCRFNQLRLNSCFFVKNEEQQHPTTKNNNNNNFGNSFLFKILNNIYENNHNGKQDIITKTSKMHVKSASTSTSKNGKLLTKAQQHQQQQQLTTNVNFFCYGKPKKLLKKKFQQETSQRQQFYMNNNNNNYHYNKSNDNYRHDQRLKSRNLCKYNVSNQRRRRRRRRRRHLCCYIYTATTTVWNKNKTNYYHKCINQSQQALWCNCSCYCCCNIKNLPKRFSIKKDMESQEQQQVRARMRGRKTERGTGGGGREGVRAGVGREGGGGTKIEEEKRFLKFMRRIFIYILYKTILINKTTIIAQRHQQQYMKKSTHDNIDMSFLTTTTTQSNNNVKNLQTQQQQQYEQQQQQQHRYKNVIVVVGKSNLVWLFIGLVWFKGPKVVNCLYYQQQHHQNHQQHQRHNNQQQQQQQQHIFDTTTNNQHNKTQQEEQQQKINSTNTAIINLNLTTKTTNVYQKQFFINKLKKQFNKKRVSQEQQNLKCAEQSKTSKRSINNENISWDILQKEAEMEEKSDRDRLESIKNQILTKLGLSRKPNITQTLPKQFVWDTIYRANGLNIMNDFETMIKNQSQRNDKKLHQVIDLNAFTDERIRQLKKHQYYTPTNKQQPVTKYQFNDDEIEDHDDDYIGSTQEIILFAENGHKNLYHQGLVEFSHPKSQQQNQLKYTKLKSINKQQEHRLFVSFAELHLKVDRIKKEVKKKFNKKHKIKIWIFQLMDKEISTTMRTGKRDINEFAQFCASLDVNTKHLGWQKIDLTTTVREWFERTAGLGSGTELKLLIDCSGCGNEFKLQLFDMNKKPKRNCRAIGNNLNDINEQNVCEDWEDEPNTKEFDANRPFLVLHTETKRLSRVRRRAIDCSGALNGQCCKESFYVSFKALGWDDWIIAPRGYFANYCRGDCTGPYRTPDTFQTFHAHFIEEYRKMGLLNGMNPCCAPIKFSSMSLIYYGDDGIIKRDLPKMVVDECGCP